MKLDRYTLLIFTSVALFVGIAIGLLLTLVLLPRTEPPLPTVVILNIPGNGMFASQDGQNAPQQIEETPTNTPILISRTLPPTFTPTPSFTPSVTPSPRPSVTPATSMQLRQGGMATPTNRPLPSPTPFIDDWSVERSRSVFDDSPTIILYTVSDDFYRPLFENIYPMLVIRCKEGRLEIFVDTGSTVDTEFDRDFNTYAPVRYRIDSNASQTVRADVSTSYKALFFRNPHEMLRSLANARKMVFQWNPFLGGGVIVEFKVRGLEKYMRELLRMCPR